MFTLVKLKGKMDTYHFINTPNSKSHLLAFKNMDTAMKYRSHVIEFHRKHGMWPCLNMDENGKVMSQKLIDYIYDYDESLKLVKYSELDMQKMMCENNMSVLSCIDFDIIPSQTKKNKYDVHLRAEELYPQVDLGSYIEILDYIYETYDY